jgi:hypothetical protein
MRGWSIKALVGVAAAAGIMLVPFGPAGAGSSVVIEVTKVVGPNTPADAVFEVSILCDGVPDTTVSFGASGGTEPFFVSESLEATCTFTEVVTSGATPSYACEAPDQGIANCTSTDGPSPAVLVVNDPGAQLEPIATVTVTNTFPEPPPDPPTPQFSGPEAIEASPNFTG